jgi:hypothetical protein
MIADACGTPRQVRHELRSRGKICPAALSLLPIAHKSLCCLVKFVFTTFACDACRAAVFAASGKACRVEPAIPAAPPMHGI